MSLFNRAKIIDQNFTDFVQSENFPKSEIDVLKNISTKSDLISLFESQVLSRHLDLKARTMKEEGKCFYTIASSGHEGNSVFGKTFSYKDMAFLHYRSGAFFIERSKQIAGTTPIYDLALSLTASSDDPISGGRHKVFGSKLLNIPPQTSTISSHIPKAVGAALSIDRAKDLQIQERELEYDSIIICSFGDASINHSTALGGFNTAEWITHQGGHVPIIFICEDNGLGISVKTPKNWVHDSFSNRKGFKYIECNGLDLIDLVQKSKLADEFCRTNRTPVFLHMKTIRLMGHAGSDIEFGYNSKENIEQNEFNDPLLHSSRILINNKSLSKDDILKLYEHSREVVNHVCDEAAIRPKLDTSRSVMKSIISSTRAYNLPSEPKETNREKVFGKEYQRIQKPQHMAKLINYALTDILNQYSNTLVFGEDVAKKGGVYNVTANLMEQYGIRRVFDSPLDETSIIGTAIGLSHNGFIPIPEIQFLAYYHNAEDQLRGEAATLPFFSKGQFVNPMVLRIPGLAYQKGFGGHFHNDNSLSVFRDLPGIIVACPSNGLDAVKMLRRAVYESYINSRITVFIEPIALYMVKDLHKPKDKKWSFKYPSIKEDISVGEFAVHGQGSSLIIISYGNGFYLSMKAKIEIEKKLNKKIKIIDLRWLSDTNIVSLMKSMGKCAKILVVDECRKNGCYGEGLVTDIHSASTKPLKIRLHAAENSFIPLGKAATVTLPSKESIINNAIELYNE
ncbi:MFS transporter [bacterium]|nr:MAG: MFS transporter [bacterium]